MNTTISASASGTLVNTATVAGGSITDPAPGNNSATDTLTPPPPTPMPALSEWGLLVLAGLVAGYGAWTLRRQSRPLAAAGVAAGGVVR